MPYAVLLPFKISGEPPPAVTIRRKRLTLYVNATLLSLGGVPPLVVTIRRKRLTLYVNATLLSLVGTILINQN
ncbi:MAG: hypothetical protein J6M07_04575 [Ruminococcus sp.]|nr:hypothetical protein [Ruminococcus sp.]